MGSNPTLSATHRKAFKFNDLEAFCFWGGSKSGSKLMLSLPIYRREYTYYLHTRVGGVQIKRSLDTGKRKVAIMRDINLLGQLMAKQPIFDINSLNLDDTDSFEMDISRGVLKSDGPEDHKMMMDTLAMYIERGWKSFSKVNQSGRLSCVGNKKPAIKAGCCNAGAQLAMQPCGSS